jgi:hypothetical protein
MIKRNAVGFIAAMISCLPLAAGEDLMASFEIAMASPFGARANDDPPPPKDGSSAKSSDQDFIAPSSPKSVLRDARTLNIFVLMGDRAVNSINTQSTTPPVVEVRDERNLPVQGAAVIFQLPGYGPGGFFAGQQLTWTGTTDANGQVVSANFTPNRETGSFTIRVTANYGGKVANATLTQRNSLKPVPEGPTSTSRGGKNTRLWKIAAVAAAGGAAGGIIWATHRSGDKPTVVLQPGNVSFGGPR